MPSPSTAVVPMSPSHSPSSSGKIFDGNGNNNNSTNSQLRGAATAFSLPSSLVVDEIDLKLHQHHLQLPRRQSQPHPHPQSYSHCPDRIQGVVMNKQQLKDLSNHQPHEKRPRTAAAARRRTPTDSNSHSPPLADGIPATIGGTACSIGEGFKACPCCRRYIRLGDFCSSRNGGGGGDSLSYSICSIGSDANADADKWTSSLRFNRRGRNNNGAEVGVRAIEGSMAEYSLDTTDVDAFAKGRKDGLDHGSRSRCDDDHSTVLAGLSLESSSSSSYDDDDGHCSSTNLGEDGADSVGVSLIQGVAFPGVRHIARRVPNDTDGGAIEAPPKKDDNPVVVRESINPVHCGGGLAAYELEGYEYWNMGSFGHSDDVADTKKNKSKKKKNRNGGGGNGNGSAEYTVTKTIVQGWLHKKGTGNDFLGMRWWKPRWVTLALARIPGHLVETPILLTHRAPGISFPVHAIVLSEDTVVMAIERTNTAVNTDHDDKDRQRQRHDESSPLDRLADLTNIVHERHSPNDREEAGATMKEEWNTHCFQIVNTVSPSSSPSSSPILHGRNDDTNHYSSSSSSSSYQSVSRIFTAPLKERNEWVFAINQAIMEYERRLAKARLRIQRPRSPSPVKATTTTSGSLGGDTAGSSAIDGRMNRIRAGLPPTSPRKVRSPSPVRDGQSHSRSKGRNAHRGKGDFDVGKGGFRNNLRLTVTP